MDFKKAIAINVFTSSPTKTSTSEAAATDTPRVMDLADALRALDDFVPTTTSISRARRKHSSKHVNDAIAAMYYELTNYWPEFGILDKCTLKQFSNVIKSICNPPDDPMIISQVITTTYEE